MRTSYDESKITDEMRSLLASTVNRDPRVASAARDAIALIAQEQLRAATLSGDIIRDIFTKTVLKPGTNAEYPLDIISPGTEKDYVGYTMPRQGYIPKRMIESDNLMLATYVVVNPIDWAVRYARDTRWDIVSRSLEVLEAGMIKKRNDDGWHLLLAAGLDRNVVVYDSDASAGMFSKRLVSLLKSVMRRNGGGNSTSISRSKLTDIYLSPEGLEDIRNWNLDQIDEITRREMFIANDNDITRIFGVNLHDIDELGEGQEYQDYYLNDLAGALQGSDLELVVGLDLVSRDVFKMPVRQDVEVFVDDVSRRSQQMGYWAEWEGGFGVLDNRSIILGSY